MRLSLSFKIASIIGLILLADKNSWSAVLPGAALPEQVGQALQTERPEPTTEVLPAIVAPTQPAAAPVGAEAAKIKFKLNGVILEGNHIFTTKQLLPLYQHKLGQTITVTELFAIVQDITNFYRNNGYIISRAILPPQHVKSGMVRIQIIEGYIGKVDVSGSPHGAKCLVQGMGNRIKQKKPLQISHMEKYLLLANEIPATQVKAVLAPSKSQPGAADLTLVTENTPITAYFSYDNYGTRYIGPQQITGNAGLNSFLASGDSLQFTLTKTPKWEELTYNDLNYNTPVSDNGTRWIIGGTRVGTHPLFVLEPADIQGLNTNYYTSLQYPAIRTRTESLTWQMGFNYLDSNVTTLGEKLYTDHVRSLGLGGTYNFADRWYGANLIYADIRQGLPILGYSSDTNVNTAETSRPGGRANYTKIDLQASRVQALVGPVSLYGIFRGQWAFNPLLASEQYTWGGSQLGRGYDVAELIGDRGAGGSLELRYDLGVGKFWLQSLQPYVFYDGGAIWNILTNASTPAKVSATSIGFGTRFYMTRYVSGNIMWGQPLTKQVAALQLIGDGWRPRVFFSLVASFA